MSLSKVDIRKVREYRFFTSSEFDNPLHDRRYRHGIQSKKTIPAGTQICVEVTGLFDDEGKPTGHEVKHYTIGGRAAGPLTERLASMDPGADEAPRTLDDLAARNFASAPWFAHSVMERMVKDGTLTLDQIQKAWSRIEESDG